MSWLKKAASIISASALSLGVLTAVSISAAAPAQAMVCGYSQELRTHESLVSIGTPLGSLDPFGGLKQVAMYGHCGNSNVRITIQTAKGNKSACVTPGESYLGLVTGGNKVTNAWYTGSC